MVAALADRGGSVLVVDDLASNNEIMARWLETRGHRAVLAESVRDAMAALGREAIDLILLDVMMPEVDGMEMLRAVRRERAAVDLPVIMVTALDQGRDIIEALRAGANDYVTKPLDFAVVLARVDTHLALKRAHEALREANVRMQRDLEFAAAVQRAFLPRAAPDVPGVHAAWAFEPCGGVGGDCFNLFATESGRVGLYMLDVSGHGVPAALTAVALARLLAPWPPESSLLRRRGPGGYPFLEPAEVAQRLNQHLCATPATRQYCTLFYGVIDAARLDLRYVSTGHPPALRLPRQGPPEPLPAEGFPIGWFEGPDYRDTTVPLLPGERLYVFSDGLLEARDPAGVYFGREQLPRRLDALRHETLGAGVARLVEEVKAWSASKPMDDDVAVLALELVDR